MTIEQDNAIMNDSTDDSDTPPAPDWQGPEDEDNPLNWSMAKKAFHTFVPTAIGFLCPIGSSVYVPGAEQVSKEFGVSRELALFPFVFYLLGLAFGPILAAPSSETLGRKIIYLVGLPSFALFTLGSGFSQGIASLTVCRFFAGLFSSPALTLGGGTIADIYQGEDRGPPMSLYIGMICIGPALGPVIGGYVVEAQDWRWTQWVILFGVPPIFVAALLTSETYKKTILQKRAKQLSIPGPKQFEKTAWESISFFTTKTITRPLHMMLVEPVVLAVNVYTAFNFGSLNAFFAAFSYVFENVYGFSVGSTGLTYLGQAVGTLVALVILLLTDKYYWLPQSVKHKKQDPYSKPSPETRLVVAMLGAPLLPISLFWFAWTARPSITWLSPVAAEAFFSCGNLLVFVWSALYLTDFYGPLYGASALASNTALRYLTAFALPLFVVQMYEGLGIGWATSLLGACTAVLAVIPFVFWGYGAQLRTRSLYAS